MDNERTKRATKRPLYKEVVIDSSDFESDIESDIEFVKTVKKRNVKSKGLIDLTGTSTRVIDIELATDDVKKAGINETVNNVKPTAEVVSSSSFSDVFPTTTQKTSPAPEALMASDVLKKGWVFSPVKAKNDVDLSEVFNDDIALKFQECGIFVTSQLQRCNLSKLPPNLQEIASKFSTASQKSNGFSGKKIGIEDKYEIQKTNNSISTGTNTSLKTNDSSESLPDHTLSNGSSNSSNGKKSNQPSNLPKDIVDTPDEDIDNDNSNDESTNLADILEEEACKFLTSQQIYSTTDFLLADSSEASALTKNLMIQRRMFRKPSHNLLLEWRNKVLSHVYTLPSNSTKKGQKISLADFLPGNACAFLFDQKVYSVEDFARLKIDPYSPLTTAMMFKGKEWKTEKREQSHQLLLQWQKEVREKMLPAFSDSDGNENKPPITLSASCPINGTENNSRNFLTPLDAILPKDDHLFLAKQNIITVADFKSVNKDENSPLVIAWLEDFGIDGEIARKSCSAMMKMWEEKVVAFCRIVSSENAQTSNNVVNRRDHHGVNTYQNHENRNYLPRSKSNTTEFGSFSPDIEIFVIDSDSEDEQSSSSETQPTVLSISSDNESMEDIDDASNSSDFDQKSRKKVAPKLPKDHDASQPKNSRRNRKQTNCKEYSFVQRPKRKHKVISSLDRLYVMNEAPCLCHTSIDTFTNLPVKFISVYDNSENLYDFQINIGTSSIPNSGMGAFLTFIGTRRLNDEAAKRSDILFDSHVYFDTLTKQPLSAKMPDGSLKSVKIAGKNIHDNENSSYWLPHKLLTDATLPSGKEIVVRIKQFDFFDYDSLVNREDGIGFMNAHVKEDYVEDDNAMFSSYNDGCGLIDLGLYGPFQFSDRKTEHDFDVKDFIFGHEPCSWNFAVDAQLDGANQIVDITDDSTGEPHDIAKSNICMYVNEVGHSGTYTQNVVSRELGENAHYYLHLEKPLQKGETVELLVDYHSTYEKSRERKGYGLANLKGETAGDDDEGTRLERNIVERKEMEKYVFEMSEAELSNSLYFMMAKIFDPVNDAISRFTSYKESKSNNVDMPPVPPPHPRQWVAKRRMEWLGELMKVQCRNLRQKRGCQHHVINNLIKSLSKKNLFISNDLPSFSESFMVSEGKTIKSVMQTEIFEEVLHKSSRFLIRPFDTSLWCMLSRNLLTNVAKAIVDWKLSKHDDVDESQKCLAATIFDAASVTSQTMKAIANALSRNRRRFPESLTSLSFQSSLLGYYAEKACLESIESKTSSKEKDYTCVDIFNVPAHVSAAVRSKKEGKSLKHWLEHHRKNEIFVVESHPNSRYASFSKLEIDHGTSSDDIPTLDMNWYILWQVLLIVHGLASECIDWEFVTVFDKSTGSEVQECIYSLEKLCTVLKVNVEDAENMLEKVTVSSADYENVRKAAAELRDLETDEPTSKGKTAKRKKSREGSSKIIKKKVCSPINKNRLFFEIVWEALVGLGWTLEIGNRPKDFYFMPPGMTRKSGFKNRVDYFDSVPLVMNFITTDVHWKDKKEVVDCFALFCDCVRFLQEKRSRKALPKDLTVEWIICQVKKEREDGIVYK